MNKQQFLEKFSHEVLELEEIPATNILISEVTDWDSLKLLISMTFFDKELKVILTPEQAQNAKTLHDFLQLAGAKLDD